METLPARPQENEVAQVYISRSMTEGCVCEWQNGLWVIWVMQVRLEERSPELHLVSQGALNTRIREDVSGISF